MKRTAVSSLAPVVLLAPTLSMGLLATRRRPITDICTYRRSSILCAVGRRTNRTGDVQCAVFFLTRKRTDVVMEISEARMSSTSMLTILCPRPMLNQLFRELDLERRASIMTSETATRMGTVGSTAPLATPSWPRIKPPYSTHPHPGCLARTRECKTCMTTCTFLILLMRRQPGTRPASPGHM